MTVLTSGRSFVNNDIVMASWRRIARTLFLGLIIAGQGRLMVHHHVAIPRAQAGASVDSSHSSSDAEAACPICALAAQAKYAHVASLVAFAAPSEVFAVAVLPETSVAAVSSIRLSARAPPAC